jgi:RNA polymerase sigma-70 factor (ECF subfamily)
MSEPSAVPIPDDPDARGVLLLAAAGDAAAWRALVEQHHERLRRMVAVRLDPRLQGRVDPSDVLQEAYLDAATQLGQYVADPPAPFFLWLRSLTGTRLAKAHRFHLGTQARDAAREVSLVTGPTPQASSAALAAHLVGREPSPSEAALRAEVRRRVEELLNGMDLIDREVLSLRHFEHLSKAETAHVLGISEAAAGKRYIRALQRLKDLLARTPGLAGDVFA